MAKMADVRRNNGRVVFLANVPHGKGHRVVEIEVEVGALRKIIAIVDHNGGEWTPHAAWHWGHGFCPAPCSTCTTPQGPIVVESTTTSRQREHDASSTDETTRAPVAQAYPSAPNEGEER